MVDVGKTVKWSHCCFSELVFCQNAPVSTVWRGGRYFYRSDFWEICTFVPLFRAVPDSTPLTNLDQQMITHIKGTITYKSPTYLVVETAGVGYHINISLHTYTKVEKLESLKILTYLQVKEDSHTLYGFADEAERSLFILLLSVQGIGANTARIVLSSMPPEEVRAAIVGEDVNAFKRVKGIGPKTAKRIILDLKDKVLKDSGSELLQIKIQDNTSRDEALSALVALGFSRIQVQKVLNRLLKEQTTPQSVEELIKGALKQLS